MSEAITLTAEQTRMIYLLVRLKLEYVIEAAAKKHNGLSASDEAAAVIHDFETAGLVDASVMNGKWWEPKHERATMPQKPEDPA